QALVENGVDDVGETARVRSAADSATTCRLYRRHRCVPCFDLVDLVAVLRGRLRGAGGSSAAAAVLRGRPRRTGASAEAAVSRGRPRRGAGGSSSSSGSSSCPDPSDSASSGSGSSSSDSASYSSSESSGSSDSPVSPSYSSSLSSGSSVSTTSPSDLPAPPHDLLGVENGLRHDVALKVFQFQPCSSPRRPPQVAGLLEEALGVIFEDHDDASEVGSHLVEGHRAVDESLGAL